MTFPKIDHTDRQPARSYAAVLLRQAWPAHQPTAAELQVITKIARRRGDRRVCAAIHAVRMADRFGDAPDLDRIAQIAAGPMKSSRDFFGTAHRTSDRVDATIDRALHAHYGAILHAARPVERAQILRAFGAGNAYRAGSGIEQRNAFTQLARSNPLGLTAAAIDRSDAGNLAPQLLKIARRRLRNVA